MARDRALLLERFDQESLAMSRVLDDAAIMAGDVRIDTGRHMHFAVFARPDAGSRRIGRIVQRLTEIETDKVMSGITPDHGERSGPVHHRRLAPTG